MSRSANRAVQLPRYLRSSNSVARNTSGQLTTWLVPVIRGQHLEHRRYYLLASVFQCFLAPSNGWEGHNLTPPDQYLILPHFLPQSWRPLVRQPGWLMSSASNATSGSLLSQFGNRSTSPANKPTTQSFNGHAPSCIHCTYMQFFFSTAQFCRLISNQV